MVISQTPVRISFLGGGNDYPAYFRQSGGETLATANIKDILMLAERGFTQRTKAGKIAL